MPVAMMAQQTAMTSDTEAQYRSIMERDAKFTRAPSVNTAAKQPHHYLARRGHPGVLGQARRDED